MSIYTLGIARSLIVFVLASLLLVTGCASTSKIESGEKLKSSNEKQEINKALQGFKEQAELNDFFKQTKGIAILPQNIRAGTGFGGAVGWGWLVVDDNVIGSVLHLQVMAGADLGIQKYRQILFFKTNSALEKFKAGTFEFAGQANATALVWGKGWNSSYGPNTALFTLIDGGLLLEGSVGAHRYDFFPN